MNCKSLQEYTIFLQSLASYLKLENEDKLWREDVAITPTMLTEISCIKHTYNVAVITNLPEDFIMNTPNMLAAGGTVE
jgi:hypothetical protein